MTQARRRQSPHGCSCPIMAIVTPEERARVEKLAEQEMRSLSGTLRMLMLRGLENYPSARPEPTNQTVQ
ncbi:hypothetical protein [Salinicola sp. RZ23]|uniref:hypothetical protein n=1 Tax=Salinicola sp. RZ23 TaxID=1949087 RepID=UPI000DA15D5E|nr:hypothetical protein [Salinicola sp. RZ23]